MTEPKSYAICDFCNCTMEPESYETMCPACLKKYEPEELEFKRIMEDSVERQKDAHGQEWLESLKVRSANVENNTNYQELTRMTEAANENTKFSSGEILEARRDALRFAHETCHKLGHFSSAHNGFLGKSSEEKRDTFIDEINEMHVIARAHMKFLIEG